jgi:hypothetical protein
VSSLEAVSSESIGFPGEGTGAFLPSFDARRTVLSQYANSPVLLALIDSLSEAIDPKARFEDFYQSVWDITSATGSGLDTWGRILGVARALYVTEDGTYLGFSQAQTAQSFGWGVFYSGSQLTTNYALTDFAYRRALLAKAALNITDGSVSSINAILLALFPDHGNCYVRDNLDMTMTFVFGSKLSKVDYAIVTQSGVLPRPIGVAVAVEQP